MLKNSLIGDLSRNKVSDTQLIKKTKLSSSKSFRTNTIQNKLDLIKVNVKIKKSVRSNDTNSTNNHKVLISSVFSMAFIISNVICKKGLLCPE